MGRSVDPYVLAKGSNSSPGDVATGLFDGSRDFPSYPSRKKQHVKVCWQGCSCLSP